jgi:hypothetical protein
VVKVVLSETVHIPYICAALGRILLFWQIDNIFLQDPGLEG